MWPEIDDMPHHDRLLEVEGLVAGYSSAEQILKKVDIRVDTNEIVALIGPNGAGKSTLLKAIAGLVKSSAGRITLAHEGVNAVDLTNMDVLQRTRAGISFVPQERNVFGTLTVRENLITASYAAPHHASPRADAMCQQYDVLREKRDALARTLSGGQRQILAMAMGLMTSPRLLMLDEPSAGLSPIAAEKLMETIVLMKQTGLPILMVEQHAMDALHIADRAYILVDGRNSIEGPASDIARDPTIRRLFLGAQ
jgi:branched-chain amino acid transport system ATP-binding protein